MAVFYRTNAQSRALEEAMVGSEIPYQVVGGTKFYDRREVKDVLAYLRVLVNPDDEVSWRRIVNVPKRGVGDSSIARLAIWAQQHEESFGEAVAHATEAGVGGRAAKGLTALATLLETLRAEMPGRGVGGEDGDALPPGDLLPPSGDPIAGIGAGLPDDGVGEGATLGPGQLVVAILEPDRLPERPAGRREHRGPGSGREFDELAGNASQYETWRSSSKPPP